MTDARPDVVRGAATARFRLRPVFTRSGPTTMFGFFTGAIEIAYLGVTPFLLGRSYGLPIRIISVAHETLVAIVVRHPEEIARKGAIRIATAFGSNGHRLATIWARDVEGHVTYVDLPNDDQIKAFEYGFVDGVAVGEPQLTQARRLGGHQVLSSRQVPGNWFNVLVSTENAIAEKPDVVEAYLNAHEHGIARLSDGLPLDDLQYLAAVFRQQVSTEDLADVLTESYRWPRQSFRDFPGEDSPVAQTVADTYRFLADVGLVGPVAPSVTDCFPASWGARRDRAKRELSVGYSAGFVAVSYFVGLRSGDFDAAGFEVQDDDRQLVERVAGLGPLLAPEMGRVETLIGSDPRLAVMALGQINERLFNDLYERATGQEPPQQLSKTLTLLERGHLVPKHILSCAHWVRSIRNVATHGDGVTTSNARNAFGHVVEMLEWAQREMPRALDTATSCGGCGASVEPGWRLCPFCGYAVSGSLEQTE